MCLCRAMQRVRINSRSLAVLHVRQFRRVHARHSRAARADADGQSDVRGRRDRERQHFGDGFVRYQLSADDRKQCRHAFEQEATDCQPNSESCRRGHSSFRWPRRRHVHGHCHERTRLHVVEHRSSHWALGWRVDFVQDSAGDGLWESLFAGNIFSTYVSIVLQLCGESSTTLTATTGPSKLVINPIELVNADSPGPN